MDQQINQWSNTDVDQRDDAHDDGTQFDGADDGTFTSHASTIPYSIGSLSNLGILNIGNNSFHGHIPRDLGQLSSLTVLSLYLNELNGEIPESIYNLSKLIFFKLANNRISGNLPSSMGNVLPDLELVPLHNNQFSGEIPISISNLSQLQKLSLNTNLFTGRVPTNLGTLQKLEILDIYDNHLTNDPSMLELDFLISLRNCSKLKTIRIGKNSFDGRLPKSLALGGNLSQSLETLEASSCGIKGIIPNEIANLSNLMWLEIGGNDLEGEIPGALSRLNKLQKLIINNSKLKGSIPVILCDLGRLFELNLENNQLSQQLPRCLGNISSLRRIYLGHNELTSVELSALWRNKNLQIVDLSYNNLNGSLGSEIGSVQGMQVLNLSGNQFSGDIPNTIGRLEHLEKLIFSSNNLHGYIPESFSELVELQYLDLSHNNLSGAIPKSLEKLPNLVYFNVSFNRLSGEIPNEGLFKNLTADSFIGNKELCGASRFKVMQCKARSSSKTRAWKYILPSIAFIICLAIIVVWLMRHRNRNTTLTSQSSSLVTVKRISYYDILKSTNNFDDENLIGRGSMGKVYKGTFSDGMIAAIKVFNLDLESANHSFDTECNILCNIRHRNLVKVISSCSNLDLKALVLDYMSKGNFSSWLYSSDYCLNMDQRLEIMIDLASALEYLHHGHPFPVVHCDLKPSNILLDEDMVAHVADFGISKLLTQDEIILHTKTLGTIGYMAPEYGSTGMISTMADVYSYGILLMETFTKKKPTDDIFAGELNLRSWLFELYPDAIVQVMDVDIVDGVEENIKAKESCFRSIMGLALECTADLPERRLNMENVLMRLKKIKIEFLSNVTEEE
ncbi:putative LRR receptor-like serine/threonine-protein kinase [Forsythia ovata]|uniref:non-specific serine/threonine protein kinase n=2 Tax=Forsythia ovata TaxID=205694 RepID=A0ABD1S7S8_9LAMI